VEAAGGVDVSAELGLTASAPADPEALIAAAPDVLLVTTSGLESVAGVDGLLALDQGALARTLAGQQRRVVAFDDQYLLGFGPRTGALLIELVAALHPTP
jgi:iron complex transport system substrate-binding protein